MTGPVLSRLGWQQPPLDQSRVDQASGALVRYRIMAFVTGVVLITGCIFLIFQYGTSVNVQPWAGYVWIAHGYLYLVYLITTVLLAFKLRWPLARLVLVALAGTIPTMSFVAEHFVTRATRNAARTPPRPVDARDRPPIARTKGPDTA